MNTKKLIKELVSLLHEIEFITSCGEEGEYEECPWCRDIYRHTKDCRLDEILKKTKDIS